MLLLLFCICSWVYALCSTSIVGKYIPFGGFIIYCISKRIYKWTIICYCINRSVTAFKESCDFIIWSNVFPDKILFFIYSEEKYNRSYTGVMVYYFWVLLIFSNRLYIYLHIGIYKPILLIIYRIRIKGRSDRYLFKFFFYFVRNKFWIIFNKRNFRFSFHSPPFEIS